MTEGLPLLTAGPGLSPWPRPASHLLQRQGLEVQGVEDLAQDLCHVVHSGLEGGRVRVLRVNGGGRIPLGPPARL